MAEPTVKDWEDRIFGVLRTLHPGAKIHVAQSPAQGDTIGVVVTYHGNLEIAELTKEVSAEELVDWLDELIPINRIQPEESPPEEKG